MKVYGLSQINQQTVDEFSKQSDVIALVREIASDPAKYKKLADDALKAVALVENEIALRNEAVEKIAELKKTQQETKALLEELDTERKLIASTHEENLSALADTKAKNKAFLDDRKRELDARDEKMKKEYAERDRLHSDKSSHLDTLIAKHKEDEARLNNKKHDVEAIMAEIEKHKARLMG